MIEIVQEEEELLSWSSVAVRHRTGLYCGVAFFIQLRSLLFLHFHFCSLAFLDQAEDRLASKSIVFCVALASPF